MMKNSKENQEPEIRILEPASKQSASVFTAQRRTITPPARPIPVEVAQAEELPVGIWRGGGDNEELPVGTWRGGDEELPVGTWRGGSIEELPVGVWR